MRWLYFFHDSKVYRWPDNGKKLVEQDADDVEVYKPDGTWLGPRKALLYGETMSGWFDERSDQISEGDALRIMAQTSAEAQGTEHH